MPNNSHVSSLRFWVLFSSSLAGCGSSDDGTASTGGNASFTTGGVTFTTGGVTSTTGGLAFTTGGAASGGRGGASSTGQGGRSASGGVSTGAGGLLVPPGPGPDGKSPYQRECHGETAMCVDVASLRCLGIRMGDEVFGYSCSNPCLSDADCSTAASSAQASAACVDFVTQKHCLLLCLEQGKNLSCPTGMGCYVYPGATTGYCLWP